MLVRVDDHCLLVLRLALRALREEQPLRRRRHAAATRRHQVADGHRPPTGHLLHERHAAAAALDPRARRRRREPLRARLLRLLGRHVAASVRRMAETAERRALHPFTLPLTAPSPRLFIFPPLTILWSLWRRLSQIWDFLARPGRVSCWRCASVVTHLRLFNPPARPGCSNAARHPRRAPARQRGDRVTVPPPGHPRAYHSASPQTVTTLGTRPHFSNFS